MGEITLVVAEMGTPVRTGISFAFPLLFILVLVLVWLLSRRIQRWFGRSLKAQQDLARAAADMAERLERIEKKLDEENKSEGQSA